jgi:hypothetical protein
LAGRALADTRSNFVSESPVLFQIDLEECSEIAKAKIHRSCRSWVRWFRPP